MAFYQILSSAIILAGAISCVVLLWGKKDLVCKMFLLEVDDEDYKKIRIFGIVISCLLIISGTVLFIIKGM